MLTGRQIDRYSRQIITPGFGGAAQERLFASRILVSGRFINLEPVLPYLAGAGAGHIALDTDQSPSEVAPMRERLADLNSDVAFTISDQNRGDFDLIFALADNDKRVHRLFRDDVTSPIILVRLESAPSIAIIPSRPPCIACADADLAAPFDGPCDKASVAAMMAAIEAIKLLAGIAPPEALLISFEGYAATPRPLHRRPGVISCNCGASRP